MNQNEPPRIQQQGRQVEVGEKTTSRKRKPTQSEIEARRGEKVWSLAREYGVSGQTIRNWLKKGIKYPRCKKLQTTRYHYSSPSTWSVWIMATYRAENKSFPDWSSIWKIEEERRKNRERWRKKPKSERAEINRRQYEKTKHNPRRIEKMRQYNRAKKLREKNNPNARVQNSLRARLRKFIKGKKSLRISNLIGCSFDEFRQHLECKFKKGMTWDNYGSAWHIDHIIPCKHFDHTDEDQVARCWHWTNLQPLWASENCSKQDTITNPQMSLLFGFAA